MSTIRVSIVEDVAEIREGLRFIVNQSPGFSCVSVFASAEEALAGLARSRSAGSADDSPSDPLGSGLPPDSRYPSGPGLPPDSRYPSGPGLPPDSRDLSGSGLPPDSRDTSGSGQPPTSHDPSGSPLDPADIVVMDIALPGSSGLDCIRRLKAAGSGMQFIVFTIYEDSDQVFEALAAGASGYLLKDTPPDRIISALRELYDGGSPMSATIARKVVSSFQRPGHIHELSPRETEILGLLSKGFLYKEIADRLHIAVGTVRQHIHRIYDKLHVQNRTEAINKAFGPR